MIVRILHEGQFDVDGEDIDSLNDVDNQVVEAISKGDHDGFHKLMARMHDIVKTKAKPVPVEELVESDLILPPADASMDEVRDMFGAEGLIPG